MKFILIFKTPNATDAIDESLDEYHNDGEEREALKASMKDVADKFVQFDEYVRIELDTDTKTATVLPVR